MERQLVKSKAEVSQKEVGNRKGMETVLQEYRPRTLNKQHSVFLSQCNTVR